MFDKLYRKEEIFGTTPSPIVVVAMKELKKKWNGNKILNVLDLGAGQGRNAAFLAKNGCMITCVDSSEIAIKYLRENFPDDCKIIHCKIEDFEDKSTYDMIVSTATLHFLKREQIFLTFNRIKDMLKAGGIVCITMFIDDRGIKTGELKNAFCDFDILLYEEEIITDPGHPGAPEPHKHQVARLIAQK